jgi:arylsulfatase A-like enzyme
VDPIDSHVMSGGGDVVPFPPTPSASIAGRTMQESVYRRRVEPRRLPADASNILVVLIDDAGPGLSSAFGGEVRTDTLTGVMAEGVSYNRFDTTAMCSPTRASLLTGRNHHRVGNGQIAGLANDWDGFSGHIPKSSATGAEVLKDYGYSTAVFGKWHNTPAEETAAAGPFENWPTGVGVRVLLRLPGRRGVVVRTEPGAQHDDRAAAEDTGGGLPPQRAPQRAPRR